MLLLRITLLLNTTLYASRLLNAISIQHITNQRSSTSPAQLFTTGLIFHFNSIAQYVYQLQNRIIFTRGYEYVKSSLSMQLFY